MYWAGKKIGEGVAEKTKKDGKLFWKAFFLIEAAQLGLQRYTSEIKGNTAKH